MCRSGVLFYDSVEGECWICEEKCNSCEFEKGQCTVCSEFFGRPYLNEEVKECVESCPEDTFKLGTTCVKCDDGCLTCFGAD